MTGSGADGPMRPTRPGLAAVARVPARTWCHAMAGPAVFIAIGAATIAVTFGGGDLVRWGPVGVDEGSAFRALLVATRALAATSATVLLAATTPMVALDDFRRHVHGRSRQAIDISVGPWRARLCGHSFLVLRQHLGSAKVDKFDHAEVV